MITHHTQLLQALIDKYNLKSYLEIGVQEPRNNFDLIRCESKTGVDPCLQSVYNRTILKISATSDEYFERWQGSIFDIVFIDGDHTKEQAKRDFENSLKCLSDNGFIVIHDCLPENEAGTLVPRRTRIWWGDVYKFCMQMAKYRDIEFVTYAIDEGCMVVRKAPGKVNNIMAFANMLNWETYKQHGRVLMNVVDEVVL